MRKLQTKEQQFKIESQKIVHFLKNELLIFHLTLNIESQRWNIITGAK
jgi:hypothetical protein